MTILYLIAAIIGVFVLLFLALIAIVEINSFIEEHESLFQGITQILFCSAFVAMFFKIMSL